MTINDYYKQIKPVLGRLHEQSHTRHLTFVQRIDTIVGEDIVAAQGQDIPPKVRNTYTAYHTAVGREDDVYMIVTKSSRTEEIEQADVVRDNTWSGVRSFLDSLQRLGTAEQQAAAKRLADLADQYKISNRERYEDQNTHTMQWIQKLETDLAEDVTACGAGAYIQKLKTETQTVIDLIALRNREQSQIDPTAMQPARQAVEDAYVHMVGVINAFAITEEQNGNSPYNDAIDYLNTAIDYYVDKVFTKDKKLKELKVGDATFRYLQGETWAEAIVEHPSDNVGWTLGEDNTVMYGELTLKKDGEAVDADAKVESGVYTLESADEGGDEGGDGGEVTPVTPE